VPIVEPEVLMDDDHSIDRSEDVTAATLRTVFAQLAEQRVLLEGMVLKPNMLLSGYGCPEQAGVEEVAERTLACFRRVVPAAVPGIAFLSGGQSDERAAAHLSAMNTIGGAPWELSFSYGRALVGAPLKVWAADTARVADAQAAFLHRARCNAAARRGEYVKSMEHRLAA
jgi:fructose-bisphosphate aldolase, class I